MNKIKIGTVQVNNSFSGQNYLPLSLGFLYSHAKEYASNFDNYEFLNPIYKRVPVSEAVELYKDADIVAFSVYVWNNNISMRMAEKLKEINPNVFILMGGCHIPERDIDKFMYDHPYIDMATVGEGERVFSLFLENFPTKNWNNVPSISYYGVNNEIITNPQAERIKDMNEIPSPFLEGYFDGLLKDNPEERWIGLWETNRGCPFACTFCTWGISALSKIRQLPEERVRDEMNYVAKRFPDLDAWILADANFGILHRDVEIARNIARIREVTPALRRVLIWESKNTSDRNFTIAHLLGHADAKNGRVLIAIQTFEEDALGATKRGNIKFDDIRKNINDFHERGMEVRTDVIFGLPGETYEGHLDTLRKCFDVGFDHITTVNAILLAGSEMEARETRDKYDLKTRHQIRMGSYGEYRGLRTIETEEIVRQTSLFSEEEIESLHGLHWLLWYGWNYGFLKPVLKYLQIEHSANPLDVLLDIHRVGITEQENLVALFSALHAELRASFFISPQEAKAHYFENENWKYLMRGQFIKPEKKTNAKVIVNPQLGLSLLDALISITPIEYQTDTFNDLVTVAKNRRINLAVTHNRADHNSMEMTISKDAAKYLHSERRPHTQDYELSTNGMVTDEAQSRILIERTQSDQLRLLLHKYNFDVDPLFAVERILGTAHHLLQYQIEKAYLEPAAVSILKS